MPTELAETIFQEGFSTKTGKHQGIGLALVARLCRQYGGAVTLEESELGGACFIAVLDRSLCQNSPDSDLNDYFKDGLNDELNNNSKNSGHSGEGKRDV